MEKIALTIASFFSGLTLGLSALIGSGFGFFIGLISLICVGALLFPILIENHREDE